MLTRVLQCGESGQAQTYFSRASLLIHVTKDKEALLSFRLSQVSPLIRLFETSDLWWYKARLFDFSARFNEAAQRYHELSFDSAIDEDERLQMLYAFPSLSFTL